MAKILLVEDDIKLALSIKKALEDRCNLDEVCGSVEDAAEVLAFYQYDAMIVDWNLPKMSGIDLIHKFA